MKIVFANGEDKGKEIELAPPFISIGRETDNDIVILKAEVSRYHAKIEKDGNIWVIRDLNSSNGVYLNGKKIDASAPLSHKDEIRIGDAEFLIIDEEHADEAAPTGDADAAEKGKDEASGKKEEGSQSSKRVKLLAAILIGMLLAFALIFVLSAPPQKRKNQGSAKERLAQYLAHRPLFLLYREEKSGRNPKTQEFNIEQQVYSLEENVLKVTLINLKDGIRLKNRAIRLTEEEIDELKQTFLLPDDFVKEVSPPPKQNAEYNERIQIVLMCGKRGNALEYVNQTLNIPPIVSQLMSRLKAMVESKLDVPLISKQEAFARGKELYDLALRLFNERTVAPENLYSAIQKSQEALVMLEQYPENPPYYSKLKVLHDKAVELHRKQIDEIKSKAAVAEKVNSEEAKILYSEILKRITNPDDPDFRYAKEKLYFLNKRLQKKRK
ncbi:MAG: FHA domain-containing protein [Lentisphaerae bacterium]|nr:MAG: FHA domain-containing protein [Lentisphaerota bacterium]